MYRIHPPCCLDGSALNTFPLCLRYTPLRIPVIIKRHIKNHVIVTNMVCLKPKGSRCPMSGKAGGHTCRILPNFMKFPINTQPAGKTVFFQILILAVLTPRNTLQQLQLLMFIALHWNGSATWKLITSWN